MSTPQGNPRPPSGWRAVTSEAGRLSQLIHGLVLLPVRIIREARGRPAEGVLRDWRPPENPEQALRYLALSAALYGLVGVFGVLWGLLSLIGVAPLFQGVLLLVVGLLAWFFVSVRMWQRACIQGGRWHPYKHWLVGRKP